MNVYFNYRDDDFNKNDALEHMIRQAIETTLYQYYEDVSMFEISVSFVTDDEIKNLNKIYRKNDKITDVLSFPMMDEISVGMPALLGDVVINVSQASRQAEDLGNTVEREISYLTVHSVLHLLGYDHIQEDDKAEMRSEEKHIMKLLGIFK